MAPLTSYWPPTMSLGFRDGMNEYLVPHLPQNPRSRMRALSHLEQKRLLSGTFASIRTCFSGSVEGRSGSVINPAPSCVRELRELREVERRDPVRLAGEELVLA